MKPALLAVLTGAALAGAPAAAHAAPRSLQATIDAARPGATVRLPAGTFPGPITIDHSLTLVGAGAGATIISGGGPVVRIASPGAPPDVTLAGLTITGGESRTADHCDADACLPNYLQATAFGGGVEIEPGPAHAVGATVTIRDSAITGNRAAPATTVDSVRAPCPGAPCRFALAAGGGIDNWGDLTLVRTRVTDNQAGGPFNSDADGGGIYSGAGSVTIDHSAVSGNRATSVPPYGRFAEGGGVFVNAGSLTVRSSTVAGNRAALTSSLPAFADPGTPIDMNAHAGGIHAGDGVPVTIAHSALVHNAVSASDPDGAPIAFDSAALIGDAPAGITDTLIAHNEGSGLSTSTEDTGAAGSVIELDGGGTIARTAIVGNSFVQRSTNGDAAVNAGLAVLNFNGDAQLATMTDSLVAHNRAVAVTRTGDAIAQGGGIFNDSLLALHHVAVRDNTVHADGPSGRAEGAGVWNSDELSGPPVELALDHSRIEGNRATGSPGITLRGGGLFTTFPVTLQATTIAGNAPDQCSGC
jgi:hypothetical protein